jgi:uncharacterized membrane protein YfcA
MWIAEILLTIFAWRKGWKWSSLLPMGIGLITGVSIGFLVGANGGDENSVRGIGFLIDLLVIGVLIYMISKGPKTKAVSPEDTTLMKNK